MQQDGLPVAAIPYIDSLTALDFDFGLKLVLIVFIAVDNRNFGFWIETLFPNQIQNPKSKIQCGA
jgi:hypothetical protein